MSPPSEAPGPTRTRFRAPTLALTASAALLAVSFFLPYWELRVTSPAHPDGLRLVGYLDHVEGPLELMLDDAATASLRRGQLDELERSLTAASAAMIVLLVVAAALVRNRWAAFLSLPALAFPIAVVADTQRWLRPILGSRVALGDAVLESHPGPGLWVAAVASLSVAGGLWLHRRAYGMKGDGVPAGRSLPAGVS